MGLGFSTLEALNPKPEAWCSRHPRCFQSNRGDGCRIYGWEGRIPGSGSKLEHFPLKRHFGARDAVQLHGGLDTVGGLWCQRSLVVNVLWVHKTEGHLGVRKDGIHPKVVLKWNFQLWGQSLQEQHGPRKAEMTYQPDAVRAL